MTRVIHKTEALASQLSVEAKVVLRGANFNGTAWTIKSLADEITDLLIELKLGRFVKGELVITNAGMAVRAFISRK